MLHIATTTAKVSILHHIIEFIISLLIRSNTFQHGRVQEDMNLIKIQVDHRRLQSLACLESWNHMF